MNTDNIHEIPLLKILRPLHCNHLSKPGSTDGAAPERVKILEVFWHSDPVGAHMVLYPGYQLTHVQHLQRTVGRLGGGAWGTGSKQAYRVQL